MANAMNYDAQASTNYKEAFALFDKRGTQRVALESLGDLLRACGQNPTLAEIRDLEKNIGSDCESTPRLRLLQCGMAMERGKGRVRRKGDEERETKTNRTITEADNVI
jgi:Ca2+-binding EF-hand superfamily protein